MPQMEYSNITEWLQGEKIVRLEFHIFIWGLIPRCACDHLGQVLDDIAKVWISCCSGEGNRTVCAAHINEERARG